MSRGENVLHSQELSLYLQRESASTTLYRVEVVVKTFSAYKSQSGYTVQKFLTGYAETKLFKNTCISEPAETQLSDFSSLCKRFYQSLCDNLNSRFCDASLLSLAQVLCPSVWPDDEAEGMMFGDKDLVKLAKLLGLNIAAALADFREHKLNAKRVGKTLGALKQMVQLYPVTSAECQHGFKLLLTDLQATHM